MARALAAGTALSALAAGGLAGQAGAVVTTPITSTINVPASGVVQDVDLFTDIDHTFVNDLEIYLTSPGPDGIRVPISTRGPRLETNQRNIFSGTTWDDGPGPPVTDGVFTDDVTATTLTPEGAMAAFVGKPANGVWTLEIVDADPVGTGTLNSWSLAIRTTPTSPTTLLETESIAPATLIPDNDPAGATSVVNFTGAQAVIQDADLVTTIPHTAPRDLTIRLASPSGTVETISSNNGFARANAFNGTTWDDSAGRPVTDDPFFDPLPATPLVPEGALGDFIGENPNGNWTLTVVDGAAGDVGQITSWELRLRTLASAPATTTVTPPANTTVTAIPDAQPDPAPVTPVTPVTPTPDPGSPGSGGGGGGGGTAPATPATPANPANPATPARPRALTPRILGISVPSTVRRGARLRVVARFNTPPLGGRVVLQRKVGTRFLIVGRAPVRNGRAILNYRPATVGRQVLRVRYRVSAGLRYSRLISVRVRPAAS